MRKRTPIKRFRAAIWRGLDLIRTTEILPEKPILTLTGDTSEEGYIICEQDMLMLFASRGIGKSLFAMGLSIALATGTEFLCWKARRPIKVLYIDGEMPGRRAQKRLRQMAEGLSDLRLKKIQNNLAILSRDQQGKGKHMPRLDTEEGQHAVKALMSPKWTSDHDDRLESHLEGPQQLIAWGARIVIIDNAACLFDPEGEKDPAAWMPAQDWLQSLRDAGITTLLIHHASRAGNARGHSAKEDLMDSILMLTRPQGYKMQDGARFKVEFTKGRSLFGNAAAPFNAQLKREGGWVWEPIGRKKEAAKDDTSEKLQERVRSYIERNPGCTLTRVLKTVKGSEESIKKAVLALLKTGPLEKSENGRYSVS